MQPYWALNILGIEGAVVACTQHMLNSQTWDPNFLGIEEAAVDSLIDAEQTSWSNNG